MRAVLDTSVKVSALLFRGTSSRLHALWRRGDPQLIESDRTLAELVRVLAYPKFALDPNLIEAVVAAEILPFAVRVEPKRQPQVCRDPDDDEFLWCARDAAADALIIGDPDLLALAPAWEAVPILTVTEALRRLAPSG